MRINSRILKTIDHVADSVSLLIMASFLAGVAVKSIDDMAILMGTFSAGGMASLILLVVIWRHQPKVNRILRVLWALIMAK